MINLKACPRCLGDMMIEELLGEADLVCLQCGHRTPLPRRGFLQKELVAAKR